MSTPIHFRGTDWASVEAMPPDVRAAYQSTPVFLNGVQYTSVEAMPAEVRPAFEEEYKRVMQEMRQMLAEAGADPETGEPLTPAWGGPRPDGGVPVPAEFDQVTSLGPAILVSPHEGVKILPNFGTPRVSVMVRYRDGLAYRTGGKDVHTLRWDEVAVIQSNLTRQVGTHGSGWTQHEYTLTANGGQKLILDDGLKEVGGEAEAIKAAVFALIGPPLVQRYQAGETMRLAR